MKAVAQSLGVARSNLMARKSRLADEQPAARRGPNPLLNEAVFEAIENIIAGRPSYHYRPILAVLRDQAITAG